MVMRASNPGGCSSFSIVSMIQTGSPKPNTTSRTMAISVTRNSAALRFTRREYRMKMTARRPRRTGSMDMIQHPMPSLKPSRPAMPPFAEEKESGARATKHAQRIPTTNWRQEMVTKASRICGKPCRAACRRYLRSSSRSLNPKSQCSAGRAISLRGLSWERSLGLLAHGGLYTFPLRAHLSVVSSCKVLILRSAALRSLSYPSCPISLPWSFSSSSSAKEATGRDHNQDPNTPVSAISAGNRFQDNESPSVSASLSLSLSLSRARSIYTFTVTRQDFRPKCPTSARA